MLQNKHRQKLNKKAVSLIVSYVLLIVIAVSISALVYTYLKSYISPEGVECPADTSLVIETADCNRPNNEITIQLSNRGLFNISGVYLRFAEEGRDVRAQLNPGFENEYFIQPLAPGKSTPIKRYSIDEFLKTGIDNYLLEVQPATFQDGHLVPCKNLIITQKILCA